MFLRADNLLQHPFSTRWSKLSFGCHSIDNCTNGGIVTRGITEIYGEAGTGKSQILMQLCLTVQLPEKNGGFQKKAVLIYTEGKFPTIRLTQIATQYAQKYQMITEDFLDGIFIQLIKNTDMLMSCLSNQLLKILETNPIGIIVIDSIGSIFRMETEYSERAAKLTLLGHRLTEIVQKYNCVVVCSNQVASVDDCLIPCLGLTWSNQVRCRIKIEKFQKDEKVCNSKVTRTFEVIYCPEIESNKKCVFSITNGGISDCN
ncbi:DNA repair protein XRCC3 [Condylostylus longicornis]|uniref:DNA repair protein XRCC3 n=1 Tax=Condylostylus longicornis TaxID=2530218 RepID=UPI00244DFCAD|nr:DNA repair protein XRCC3 [Condylostylus longicornis]